MYIAMIIFVERDINISFVILHSRFRFSIIELVRVGNSDDFF